MTETRIDLPAAMQELEQALRQLEAAREKARAAQHEEINAINRVNNAQRAFDQQVAAAKTRCGLSGTDWARPKERAAEE